MRARLIILTLTLLTSGLAGQVLAETTGSIPVVYVDASATGANDGSSWADAYNDLQDALDPDNTASPAEVWVAAGVYKPVEPEDFGNPTIDERDESFNLRNGLTIYGGFAGVETQLDQRDWEENLTVLSGDIANSSNTDANGIVNHPSDLGGANSYSIIVSSETAANAILDGFVVTGGWANDDNNACQRDRKDRHGAAIYNDAGNPTILNFLFVGNEAKCHGSVIYNVSDGRPTFNDGQMISNASGSRGGAIYSSSSTLELIHIEISGNTSGNYGGAIYASGELELIDGVLSNNTGSSGGAIYFRSGMMKLSNAVISGNLAERGAGIYHQVGNSTLTNVVIAGNRATSSDSGGISSADDVQLFNTIIWGNQIESVVGSADSSFTGEPIVRHSLIQGHNPSGEGNFDCSESCPGPRFLETFDPAFAPSAEGDFRLGAGSPAIDAGNNSFVEVDFDLDGNPRIQNEIVDLGPYESEGPIFQDRFE